MHRYDDYQDGRVSGIRLPDTLAELYDEHGTLVEKKLDVGLSSKESARLSHVRWQLDALEVERKHLPARMTSRLEASQAELDKCRALLQDAWKALHK